MDVFQVEVRYLRPSVDQNLVMEVWLRFQCNVFPCGKNNPRLDTGLQLPWPFTAVMLQQYPYFRKNFGGKPFPRQQNSPHPSLTFS